MIQQSFAYRCWLFGVGVLGGGLIAYHLPLFSFFAVPILFGWFAGGGTTPGPFVYGREAVVLSIGAVGAVTFIMTFTLGGPVVAGVDPLLLPRHDGLLLDVVRWHALAPRIVSVCDF